MNELSRLHILVIEDDDDARDLMQAVLEQRGATVTVAESVATAFDVLAHTTPDVIVSDIAMPEEDGIAFVRRLRSRSSEEGGQIPSIAVSAFVANSDRVRALSAGFDKYLFKPVDFDELCRTIRSILAREGKATA